MSTTIETGAGPDHSGPARHHLEHGRLDEDTAILVCSRSNQPYVFDPAAEPPTDPHDCFCDAARHVLVDLDDPDVARLVCGSCSSPIAISETDEGTTFECSCEDDPGYDVLPKSVYTDNSGVFLSEL